MADSGASGRLPPSRRSANAMPSVESHRPLPSPAGTPLPAGRPAQGRDPRRHVVVEDRPQHGQQLLWAFPGDLGSVPCSSADPQVAVVDLDRLPRQPHQPLDVVGRGVAGISEYDHVPTLRLAEHVGELGHQNAVAVVCGIARVLRVSRTKFDRLAAERAGAAVTTASRVIAVAVGQVAGADLDTHAAHGAVQVLVAAHQGRGHGAGGNDERLGLERAKQKGQHEGHDDRFDRLANARRRRYPRR